MKVSKQSLIDWATNLKSEDVDVELEMCGGGSFDQPDGSSGWCCGYKLTIDVGEDAPDAEKGGIDFPRPCEMVTG